MIAWYEALIGRYPICSIEDGWARTTATAAGPDQAPGLARAARGRRSLVTNPASCRRASAAAWPIAVLVKVNQIARDGDAGGHRAGQRAAGAPVISHRSGETEDHLHPDLGRPVNAGISRRARWRGERTGKYNQLLRIEEERLDRRLARAGRVRNRER